VSEATLPKADTSEATGKVIPHSEIRIPHFLVPDPTDTPSRSPAGRVWYYVKEYWMWPVLVAVGLYVWNDISPSVDLPASGPPAPDFRLERMNGETFHLRAHRGEVVILNVWATWCPPCRYEIPGFNELQAEYADRPVTFVGLSVDDGGLDDVRAFAQEQPLEYPQTASQSVAYRKYDHASTIPRTYVIDKQGRIRYQHTGLLLQGALRPMIEELLREGGDG
jgi:peroxiredoxin